MELLFLWVDEFKLFKNRGFNFSSQFLFESNYFTDASNKENIEIRVEVNQDHINLFPSSYHNVTGILGQNASGKTTLFNLLKIFSGDLSRLAARVVFCYRVDNSSNTIHTIYYGGGKEKPALNVKVEKGRTAIEEYDLIILKSPRPYIIKKKPTLLEEVEYDGIRLDTITPIFFSNSFDSYREDVYSKVVNISTNFKAFDSARNFLKNKYVPEKDENTTLLNQVNPLFHFFEEDLKEQIDYITYAKKSNPINNSLPSSLKIGFKSDDLVDLITTLSPSFLFNKEDIIKINREVFATLEKTKNGKERILSIIYLFSFFYALKVDLFMRDKSNKSKSDTLIYEINKIANSSNIPLSIKNFIKGIQPDSKKTKLANLAKIYDGSLERLLDKLNYKPRDHFLEFEFEATPHLWEFIRMVLDIQYLGDPPFLTYSWHGISSGQEALLRQYSRFYTISENVTNLTLWIMVDEGELYFHPDWQKGYLNNLINFLPKIFRGVKIQLFISSHSPFVASDLPKSNIIFLHHDQNVNIKETFGSNIHTLFTNSFFLSGLLGDFAKKNIDAAIDYLNHKPQEIFRTDDEVQKLIRVIGEPILKNQLQKMLDSKRIESLQGRYTDLEKRVGKIEKRD